MLMAFGILALVVILALLAGAMLVGARHAREEAGPESEPTDFVAPTSSGRFEWRSTTESTGEFKARVDRENAERAKSTDSSK
ncbi:MAG TPA: hypothetical protein VF407_19490 [Polyangiaceae bacterium]